MLDKDDLRLILAACIASGSLARGAATPNWVGEALAMADKLIAYQKHEKEA
jgi:hypothetical protein